MRLGAKPFVFDRAKMLVGDPTATFQTTKEFIGEDLFLPSDLDGVIPPPAGDPNHFVAVTIAADEGGSSARGMLRHRERRKRLPPFTRYGTFMLTGTTQIIPPLGYARMFLQQTLPCSLASIRKGSETPPACPNWAYWTRWTPLVTG